MELTYAHLDVSSAVARVKSPKAGAVVLFAGKLKISSVATKIPTLINYPIPQSPVYPCFNFHRPLPTSDPCCCAPKMPLPSPLPVILDLGRPLARHVLHHIRKEVT